MAQHKAIAGLNEVACQGHRRHATMACDYVGLHDALPSPLLNPLEGSTM